MTDESRSRAAGPASLSGGQRMRFLARDTAFYGIAAITNKAFFLITLPLLARHFGVEAYGSIDFLYVLILFFTAASVMGQDSAVARLFWDDDERDRRRQVLTQSLIAQAGIALGLTGLLLAIAPQLSAALPGQESPAIVLQLAILHLPFMVALNFAQGVLKWTFSRKRFAIITLGQTALNALLLLVAVLRFDATIADVFIISLASRATFAALGLAFCGQWLVKPQQPNHLPALLAFGLPLGVIGAVGSFVPVLERATVGALLGPTSLGFYAAGATIALIISLPVQAFQTAWGPFFLAIHREPDAAMSYDQVFRGFAVICSLCVIGLVGVAPAALVVLTGPEYADGAIVVLPLALALAIQGVSWVGEIGITLAKRAQLQLLAYGAFLLVGAVSIALLGTTFGIVGVAGGVLLGHIAKAVAATTLAQRAFPLKWSFTRVAGVLGVAALLAAGVNACAQLLGPVGGALAAIAAGTVVVIVAWIWVFDRAERTSLVNVALIAWRVGRRSSY